jgi:TRAP-type C4-dicarboxylate transport system substrate-binding protein
VLLLALVSARAYAEPVVLRFATVAPDGSGWARLLHAFGRDVEQRTEGRARIKWYLNAVAGDEEEMAGRLERGQLDGVMSGGMICQRVMPSMRVLRFPGLFQSHDEATHVMYRLQALLEKEASEAGFLYLFGGTLGPDLFFSRAPVRDFKELKRLKFWRWTPDGPAIALNREMGLSPLGGDLDAAGRMFDRREVDGFAAIPTAALVYQWTLQAPYVLNLEGAHLFGCGVLSARVAARLSVEDQRALQAASARLADALNEESLKTDHALLNGALQHQGVHVITPSESLRAEFFNAAVAARARIGATLAPQALIDRVLGLLSDYRAEHPTR